MQRSSRIQKSVIEQFLEARKENEESFYSHPSYKVEKELIYWISQANEEKAVPLLFQINNLKRPQLSYNLVQSLKNSLICSCTIFTRATIEAGVTPEYAFDLSDVFIRKLDRMQDYEQLESLEFEMLHHFIRAIRVYQKNPYQNEIVDRAVHYIHDNILQALTLVQIAEETNVSASYLSSLFHKIVGLPLIGYINKKKIDESKYFLKHTDSSLLDIALLFGFCNQSYYTSLFKRYNEVTPKQYKQKYS